MLSRIVFAAVFVLGIGCSAASADSDCRLDAFNSDQLINLVGRYAAYLRITNQRYDGTSYTVPGTAVLLTYDGYLLTAKHVIANPENFESQRIRVQLTGEKGQAYDAEFVAAADNADLALLRISVPIGTHFRDKGFVFGFPQDVGADPIIVVGYPLYQSESSSGYPDLRCGALLNPKAEHYGPYYLTTGVTNPGVSGGPIITKGETLLALAIGMISQTTYLTEKREVNDTYLVQPLDLAFPMISADRLKRASNYPPADTGYDLKADMDKYFIPLTRVVIHYGIDEQGDKPSLIPTADVHTATITSPANATIQNCILPPEATAQGAVCSVNSSGSAATVSISLSNPTLLSKGETFKSQAEVVVQSAP